MLIERTDVSVRLLFQDCLSSKRRRLRSSHFPPSSCRTIRISSALLRTTRVSFCLTRPGRVMSGNGVSKRYVRARDLCNLENNSYSYSRFQLQGSLFVASLIHTCFGLLGVVGFVFRQVGPLCVACSVSFGYTQYFGGAVRLYAIFQALITTAYFNTPSGVLSGLKSKWSVARRLSRHRCDPSHGQLANSLRPTQAPREAQTQRMHECRHPPPTGPPGQ